MCLPKGRVDGAGATLHSHRTHTEVGVDSNSMMLVYPGRNKQVAGWRLR